jgi:diguanylate cyclase (GGDEF)-like protein
MIAVECSITPAILLSGKEHSTRAPRVLMSTFLVPFALLEFVRAWVAFGMHLLPDSTFPSLVFISAVAYIVNVSLLPLAVIWMMNARLESELQQQIVVDELTNVYNRRGLAPALDRELAHYRRYGDDFSLVLLDLDHFKQLNDAYGHAAGDAALIAVAEFLRRRLRETDVLARIGGEEFLILLPHTTLAAAELHVEMLCRALRETRHMLFGASVQVTASWGITNTSGRTDTSANELFREADFALYRAKNSGRDRVCIFAPDDTIGDYRPAASELYSI